MILKRYTAIFILKVKHLMFVYLEFNPSEELIYNTKFVMKPSPKLIIPLYYELMDNLVALPKQCERDIILKKCVYL